MYISHVHADECNECGINIIASGDRRMLNNFGNDE